MGVENRHHSVEEIQGTIPDLAYLTKRSSKIQIQHFSIAALSACGRKVQEEGENMTKLDSGERFGQGGSRKSLRDEYLKNSEEMAKDLVIAISY